MNTPELFSRLFTPARLWEKAENGLRCRLCARNCLIPEGAFGACGVRLNQGGSLYTAVGNRVAAVNLDPVEKKPLFHFLPGSTIFSVGTLGCNFHCSFCQNSSISQIEPDPAPGPGSGASPSAHPSAEAATGRAAGPDSASSASGPNALPNTFPETFPGASPAGAAPRIPSMLGRGQAVSARELADAAERSGARSLAYTYNEPTVFFELLSDTAALALERGLRNVLVSNGFLSREAFAALRDLIQAANFDLKSFSPDFYRDLCGASLAP
ncbi:radical SAM protein, partial [Desulfovibrio sp. OttesenSCG-928-C14]|nr:radical SAM protein [Desulfovibrio sp. OttesenSCG-928-C14]